MVNTELIDVDTSRRRTVDLTDAVRDILRNAAVTGCAASSCRTPRPASPSSRRVPGPTTTSSTHSSGCLPRDDRYRHSHGSPGHGADHVLPGIVAPSVTVPVLAGEPLLGTWQSVVLVDLNRDNPRRSVRLSFVGG